MEKNKMVPMPGIEKLTGLKKETNQDLLDSFEITIMELTKAANGLSQRSEASLGRRAEKLKTTILQIMNGEKGDKPCRS